MPPKRASTSRREDGSDDEVAGEQRAGGLSQDQLHTAASQLVRMALFHEYKRRPLQRKNVTSLILPTQPRAFPLVLQRAQLVLRNTFGMELHELRTKQKAEEIEENETQKKKGKRKADGTEETAPAMSEAETQRQARGAKGSGNFVLRSVLPADVIAGMANPVSLPIGDRMSAAEQEAREADSGALLQWEKADGTASGSVALLGIRTVILCLVLCLGRVTEDNTLHGFLRRLNLHRDTVLPYKSSDVAADPMTLDKYLDLLAKQNYLEKAKVKNPTGEGTVTEWRWGSRESEFSEQAAATFIEQMFLGAQEEESDDEEDPTVDRTELRQTAEQRREAKRRKLRTHLERVAGGPLLGEL